MTPLHPAFFACAALAIAPPPIAAQGPKEPHRDSSPSPHAHIEPNEVSQSLSRAGATLRLTIRPARPTVADSIVLELEAESPDERGAARLPRLDAPAPGADVVLGDFRVAQVRDEPPRLSSRGRSVARRTLVLEPFLARAHHLPSFTASFDTPSGPIELSTEPMEIEVSAVEGVTGEHPEPAEFRGPVSIDLPPDTRSVWPWAVGSVGATAAALGLAANLRRRQRPSALPSPLHEARTSLDACREQLAAGEVEAAIVAAGAAIRRYAARRLGVPGIGLPTPELISRLGENTDIPAPAVDRLASSLRSLDEARFAPGSRPSVAAAKTLLDAFEALIDATSGPPFDTSTVRHSRREGAPA